MMAMHVPCAGQNGGRQEDARHQSQPLDPPLLLFDSATKP